MAKARTSLGCTSCGQPAAQWAGRCPSCGEWGTIEERMPARATGTGRPAVVSLVADAPEQRVLTGFAGVDRVLGGGLVPASVVLLAGEPGIGKSTLLLQIASRIGTPERPALYASGEESLAQVAARARRLGVAPERLSFVAGRELADVVDAAASARPSVLMVDSIQSIRDPMQPSLPGGTSQVRACTDVLVGLAKREGVGILLAGQVTKDGDIAGPRTLEHAVDVVCSFDGDAGSGLRILTGGKNRFGEEGEVAWFEMGSSGLNEVSPPSLEQRDGEPGSATALVRAGRSAMAVEVQALVAMLDVPPRRNASGLDPRRFAMVAAVTDGVLRLRLGRAELYGAAAGGINVQDPAADLAIAAALASTASGRPPPRRSAFVGEVTLNGLVRPAPNLAARLRVARAAGIEQVFCAADRTAGREEGVHEVHRLADALRWARGDAPGAQNGPSASRRSGLAGSRAAVR